MDSVFIISVHLTVLMITNVGEFGDGGGGVCPRTAGSYSFGCGKNLWATYTVVPSANQTLLWWTALAFGHGKGANAGSVMLLESDLAPMVDTNQTIGQFSDIPRAAFEGASASFASTSQLYVSWQADIIQQRGCDGVIVSPWTSSRNITLPTAGKNTTDGPTAQINLAPVFGSVALLGEAGAAGFCLLLLLLPASLAKEKLLLSHCYAWFCRQNHCYLLIPICVCQFHGSNYHNHSQRVECDSTR